MPVHLLSGCSYLKKGNDVLSVLKTLSLPRIPGHIPLLFSLFLRLSHPTWSFDVSSRRTLREFQLLDCQVKLVHLDSTCAR